MSLYNYFGQNSGTLNIVYSYLEDINTFCNGEAFVTVPFDLSMLTVDLISTPNGAFEAQVTGGTPPYSFVWNDGTTSQSITSPVDGFNYEVTVTDLNACQGIVSEVYMTTNLNSIENFKFSCYPNPSTGRFTISNMEKGLQTFQVFDIHGNSILMQSQNSLSQSIAIDLSAYPKGTYISGRSVCFNILFKSTAGLVLSASISR